MKYFLVLVICVASISAGPIGAGGMRQKPILTKDLTSRITGGDLAAEGQFPFAAAIYLTMSDENVYFCEGAILSRIFLLTSGHCVSGATQFDIILGRENLMTDTGLYLETTISILHPSYNEESFENDLGLVHFRGGIEFTDSIQPVALPTADLEDGQDVTALGWGATSDSTSAPVDDLHFVSLTVLSRQDCEATYGNQVPENIACAAGADVEGPCFGDLGSPLVLAENNNASLVGLNSFIKSGGSCEVPEPSGYTKTYPHLDWIKSTTGLN